MTTIDHVSPVQSPASDSWLRRFAGWFDPYGILIAVCALIVAFATLWTEFDLRDRILVSLKEEKELRERMLIAWQEERLLRELSLVAMLADRLEVAVAGNAPYAGHVPILERLVRMNVDLRALDMSAVPFDVDGGMNVAGADLSHVFFDGSAFDRANFSNAVLIETDFRKAQLARAVFQNAILTKANFANAEMMGADLTGAVLTDAVFADTDVSDVNFRDDVGLSQRRLDAACADAGCGPSNLPHDGATGKRLTWRARRCPR